MRANQSSRAQDNQLPFKGGQLPSGGEDGVEKAGDGREKSFGVGQEFEHVALKRKHLEGLRHLRVDLLGINVGEDGPLIWIGGGGKGA